MKKRKKKLKKRKFLFFLFKIFIIVYLFNIFINYNIKSLKNNITTIPISSNYKTIKKDTIKTYDGIGQEKVKNKDGYFTTFTTIDNNKKTYIEYKQNGNASWSKNEYWGGTMADNACGITAIATILSGYGKNYTPEDLRKKYFPVLENNNISKELSTTFGIKNTDFYYDSVHLSKESLIEHLLTNRPILVCVWNKPNTNRWTKSSHYMVLLATDGNNMIYISNPNGGENDSKSSGWYNYKSLVPYLAKALYIESY